MFNFIKTHIAIRGLQHGPNKYNKQLRSAKLLLKLKPANGIHPLLIAAKSDVLYGDLRRACAHAIVEIGGQHAVDAIFDLYNHKWGIKDYESIEICRKLEPELTLKVKQLIECKTEVTSYSYSAINVLVGIGTKHAMQVLSDRLFAKDKNITSHPYFRTHLANALESLGYIPNQFDEIYYYSCLGQYEQLFSSKRLSENDLVHILECDKYGDDGYLGEQQIKGLITALTKCGWEKKYTSYITESKCECGGSEYNYLNCHYCQGSGIIKDYHISYCLRKEGKEISYREPKD